MKTSEEIVKILHSIKAVRLDKDGDVEVQFTDPCPTAKDGWEPNSGFNYNSFTDKLLDLIEMELNGELPS